MNFLTDKFRQTSLLDVYVFRFLGLFGFWNLTEARCRSDLRLVADSESRGSNVQPASQGFLLTHTLSFCWIAETEGTPNLPLLSPNLEWIHILLLKITSCSIHRYFSEYEQGNQHANHCESEHEMPDQQKPCCCPVKAHAGRWVWLTFNFGFSWENENILFLTENFCQWPWKPWRCNSASLSDLYRFFEAWFEHCIMVAEMWTRD